MKEILVVFLVILILLGLTAYRYRQQLAAMLHVWRVLKQARGTLSGSKANQQFSPDTNNVQLVNCAKCGSWVARNESVRITPNTYLCVERCAARVVDAA
ncbi:MAG: hypothetical protein WBD22_03535 [Pyrinomonadaceae bacterium]